MSAPAPVRALVVEDEPLARRALRDLVSGVGWLALVGEASDGLEAVRLIDALEPDLVFLDVHLPELDGLGVLERVRHDPMVVFTTAHDRYAVAAFEQEAVDYLVKPFGRKRFQLTLERVRARLLPEGERAPGKTRWLRRLFGRRGSRIVPLPVTAVSRIEAAGDAVVVWAGSESCALGRTLGEIEGRLDPERFRRVHRSLIVNFDHVAAMEMEGRRLVLTLRDGARVVASRAASQRLREWFE